MIAAALLSVLALSCSRGRTGVGIGATPPPSARASALKVVVSIAPQAFFVKRIAADRATVTVLVGPGQSHHTYEPTPQQVADLAEARVYFTLGLPFEQGLVAKVRDSCPDLSIVNTTEGIKLRSISADEAGGEGHADADEAGAPDPHTWLDPRLAKVQSATIAAELERIDPEGVDEYRGNLAGLSADLDAVHAELAEALGPLKGSAVFVYHPAFGYLLDAYGLKQVAVEVSGKEPSARQLAELVERARRDGARVIFVQPQFPQGPAETIAREIGGAVVPLDPMAEDYIANLKRMADAIRGGLGTGGAQGERGT